MLGPKGDETHFLWIPSLILQKQQKNIARWQLLDVNEKWKNLVGVMQNGFKWTN